MKNRRLTLFFVVMTLAVSPQVWQKLGNLWDAIQHRAQFTMLGLVLSPRSAGDEVESEPQSPMVEPQHPTSCQGATLAQAQLPSQPKALAALHKMRTERRVADSLVTATAEIADLSDKDETIAFNLQDAQGETAPHLNNLAHESSKPTERRSVTFQMTNTALEKSDVAQTIVIPQINSAAPAFVENINFQWKLKKILDENRSNRQKTRCPLSKALASLPSS